MTGAEIAIIAALAGGTVATVGAIQQGKAQERAAKASAEFNAQSARDDAAQKTAAGKLEAERLRRRRIDLTKTQTVGFGKSGVTSEGTPIAVLSKSAADEELNANLAQHNFEIGAARSLSEASVFDLKKKQASSFRRAGNLQATGSLLSSVGQAGTIKSNNPSAFRRN